MSYDVDLETDLGGPEPFQLFGWNCTSNCAPMWREAGADLAEFEGKLAGDCIPILAAAIDKMRSDPQRYRTMDSPNGWGTFDQLVPALCQLLSMMSRVPNATVRVSR